MLRRVYLVCAVLGVLAWPVAGQAQSSTRGLHAERFHTQLTLQTDGSLLVEESVTFSFTDRSFHEVERRIPIRRTDGVTDVQALMDGQPLGDRQGPGQVRIRAGRRELRVRWRFPATTDTTHTFTLRYRATGVIAREPRGAHFEWFVLPTRHRYAITQAEVRWEIPEGAASPGGPALVAEGWTWQREDSRTWSARKSDIAVDETATLVDTLDAETLSALQPRWQVDADRARQLAPAFIVGALVLLVMGAGAVVMTRLRYHVPRQDPRPAIPANRGAMPPAMATALRGRKVSVGPAQVSATFLDLAARGVFRVEEHEGVLRVRLVERSARHPGLHPHEHLVVEAFAGQPGDGATAWPQVAKVLQGIHNPFVASVLRELDERGLVDPERRVAARGLAVGGVVALVLGIGGLVVAGVALARYGDAVLLIPGAIVVIGVALLIAGGSFPTLSAQGMTTAGQWRARVRWIKETAAQQRASDLTEWVPVAVGAGLATSVAAAGVLVPWLSEARHPSEALNTMLASMAGTSSGATYGGGGGVGGIGGGGFSGAR